VNAADGVRDRDLHERIVALDADRGSYPIGKLEAHRRNVPHLAVSIFVFRGERLLLQRRATTKYHSGGLWANTVCSHPRWGESVAACAARRLQEELGWATPLREFGRVEYEADVGGGLHENEHVHCFVGAIDEHRDTGGFDPDEVAEVAWLTIPEILARLQRTPEAFTAWFRLYLSEHRPLILSLLD